MGSIMGSILTGFGLGVDRGPHQGLLPEASNTVIFVIMVIVLLSSPPASSGRSADGAADRRARVAPSAARDARQGRADPSHARRDRDGRDGALASRRGSASTRCS
jgi:hypothetical protein